MNFIQFSVYLLGWIQFCVCCSEISKLNVIIKNEGCWCCRADIADSSSSSSSLIHSFVLPSFSVDVVVWHYVSLSFIGNAVIYDKRIPITHRVRFMNTSKHKLNYKFRWKINVKVKNSIRHFWLWNGTNIWIVTFGSNSMSFFWRDINRDFQTYSTQNSSLFK